MRRLFLVLGLLATVSIAAPARAHLDISYPPMRHQYAGNVAGQKVPPCGSGPLTGMVTGLVGGQSLTVTWDETVPHPGHFRVALDTDQNESDDFVGPVDENDMTVQGNIIAYVPDPGGSTFEHTFALPDIDCNPCTLQVMQVMTDKLGDGFTQEGDCYHWCADVTITKSTSGEGGNAPVTSSTGAGVGGGSQSGDGGGGSSATGNAGPALGFPEEESGCSMGASPARGAGGWLIAALALLLKKARWRSGTRRSLPTRGAPG